MSSCLSGRNQTETFTSNYVLKSNSVIISAERDHSAVPSSSCHLIIDQGTPINLNHFVLLEEPKGGRGFKEGKRSCLLECGSSLNQGLVRLGPVDLGLETSQRASRSESEIILGGFAGGWRCSSCRLLAVSKY